MNTRYLWSRLAFCVSLLLLLSGCITAAGIRWFRQETEQVFLLPEDEDIRLTTGEIDEPYEEIAIIAVHDYGPLAVEELSLRLLEEARALGADAVIRVDYDLQRTSGENQLMQTAIGTAVRLLDLSER